MAQLVLGGRMRIIRLTGAVLLILAVGISLLELLATSVLEIMDFYTPNFIWPTSDYLDIDLMGPIILILGVVGLFLAEMDNVTEASK